jgi:hypothetical protein
VRARAVFAEFGDDMEQHPAPFDLRLFTRTHGGRYELLELNATFDMAKSIFGELRPLDKGAAEFNVDRPGLTNFAVVVQRSAVLAYLTVTVTVIEPTQRVRHIEKRCRLRVTLEGIHIIDDSDPEGSHPR